MSANSPPGTPSHPPANSHGARNRVRWLWGVCAVAAACVIVSIWMRNRPASETVAREHSEKWPVESNSPPAVTSGIVAEQIQSPLLLADTNSPEAQLVSQLLNPSLPLKTRRQAARALAKLGSDNSITALKTALRDGPPYLKAAIGEGLGESPHPEARTLLIDLIDGTDETAARGAVRGFALRGDAEATDILANLLFDAQKPESVRTEAALALGEVQQPGALSALTRAVSEIQDPAIIEQVLEGLGRRPFAETEQFFSDYLASPGLAAESKVAALEALGNSTGDVAALVLKYAVDPDPEVRAAAAWALSATETHTDIAPQLLELLKGETSPEARARLYEALGGQENDDSAAVLALVHNETDLTARQAGLGILAELCRSAPTPELLAFFNQTAVPELENRAVAAKDLQDRLASVMTLRRAGTPESASALENVVRQSNDRKIVDAAQAALRVNSSNTRSLPAR